MKNNFAKILLRPAAFLFVSALLTSCQGNPVHQSGLLTRLTGELLPRSISLSRKPASAAGAFEKFQDTKQIYIYCQLSEAGGLDPRACYESHLKETLSRFGRKERLPASQFEKIKKKHSFEAAKHETEEAVSTVFLSIQPMSDKLVEKRVAFCKDNARFYIERCLKQYLKKETFQALNSYQQKSPSMNGHEYLFLKKRIEQKLIGKLDAAMSRMETGKKKS